MVKNRPEMKEPWVRSLGCEDPLEKGMVTHSSILAWRTARTEEPGGLPSMGSQEPDTTEQVTHTHTVEKGRNGGYFITMRDGSGCKVNWNPSKPSKVTWL